MEREPAAVTVEPDIYNSMLITYKTLRDVEKEGVPVTIKVNRSKSVELDIAVKILEQFETGAIQGAGALLVVGLWHYLKRRMQKLEATKKRKPVKEEYIRIVRQTTEWREIVRRYHPDEDRV